MSNTVQWPVLPVRKVSRATLRTFLTSSFTLPISLLSLAFVLYLRQFVLPKRFFDRKSSYCLYDRCEKAVFYKAVQKR